MNKTILLLTLLLIPLTTAYTTTITTTPTANATTLETIGCTITLTGTGTLSANITWYKNNNPWPYNNQTLSLTSGTPSTTTTGSINPDNTTKNDVWTCQATTTNTTTTNTTNTTPLNIVNSAPIVDLPAGNQTADEDSPYATTASAHDPDGDPIITWISSDLNSSLYPDDLFTINPNTGLISFQKDYPYIGNHSMVVLASDGELFGGKIINYEVLAVNDSPILGNLADQTDTEGNTWNYTITASDEEHDLLNYSYESDIAELYLVQLNNTHADLRLSSGTWLYSHRGTHTINITVYENITPSRNDTGNFTINITTINRIPTITSINYTTTSQGNPFTLNITANDTDNQDTLNFSINTDCGITNPWTITTIDDNNTNATGRITVANLTNDHIICKVINLSVTDYELGMAKATNSTIINLTITNTNDDPVLHEISNHENNTPGQNNISNLTGATNIAFTYYVNATDVDSLTYENEILNYSADTTLFNITSTGKISFTPNSTQNGTYNINITVTDDEGANDTRTLTIIIIPNTAPVLDTINDLTCQEDENCTINLTATDAENNALTYTLTLINASTSINVTIPNWNQDVLATNITNIHKNWTNNYVGNQTYNITVQDSYGATDSTLWTVTINNTNDRPFFDSNRDNVSNPLAMPAPIVEGYQVLWTIYAYDPDTIHGNEPLNITTTITGPNTSLFNTTPAGTYTWNAIFTPNNNANGEYTLNISVEDDEGSNTTQIINFTVYNQSTPPNITAVTPFYNTTLNQTRTTWADTAHIGDNTHIYILEGQTYTYNITYTDIDTADENITINWTIDGTQAHTATGTQEHNLTIDYDYFSSGTYTIIANITDNRYSNDYFTWNVTVSNVNRPPQFRENLTDRSINDTVTILDYMNVFYDPDDDTDSDGTINGNETNTLTYTHTSSTLLNITFSGPDTTFTPLDDGTTTIIYTARDDGGQTVNSNNVSYNVTAEEEEIEEVRNSGGGGGGGGATAIPIPITDDPEPITIEIVVPGPLTMYYNQTMAAPLTLQNPSEYNLRGIKLSASTEAENVTFSFTNDAFEILQPGEERNTTLYITNYRDPGSYKILVTAMVNDPEVNDTAVILINSLEQTDQGTDVDTRVTFARDLLAANPECIELNELIEQAQRALETGQQEEAQRLLDGVIEGCRYLVTESARTEETAGINIDWILNYRYTNIVLAILLLVLVGIAILLFLHYHSASQED